MKLVIFDVDGTLIDSQAMIVNSMGQGLAGAGLPTLSRAAVLSIVGLSLPQAVATLLPGVDMATQARVVAGYKTAYTAARQQTHAPLYPGAETCLRRLDARGDLLLAVATGNSRRGLDGVIAHHGLGDLFISLQTADGHPSKPHPSMVFQAMADAGIDPADTVMVGDTSFDMEMAVAAGATGFGVAWGYHPAADLHTAGAAQVFDDFATLTAAIEAWAA